MGNLVGYNGTVTFGSGLTSTNSHSWSLDVSADELDATDFTSTGWRKKISGLKTWSGTVELYTDNAVRVQISDIGAEVTAKFYFSDSTACVLGKALVIGWSPAVAVDGIETQSIKFAGSSDLTSSDA